MQITEHFKSLVIEELLADRKRFSGSDTQFAKMHGLAPSVYSRLANGEREGLVSEGKLLDIAQRLNLSPNRQRWAIARTNVYVQLEEEITICQKLAKGMIFVDECAIGKTVCARHIARHKLVNAFYLDCSQSKTKQVFVRNMAKAIGLDHNGRYVDVKERIKYALKVIEKPVVILDEAGDLDYNAFLELKEFYNATEGSCGWYMIGADGLKDKIERGIRNHKVGYREIFSRFSDNYMSIVPRVKHEREAFYRELLEDVLKVNMDADKYDIGKVIKKCLVPNQRGDISGLRRTETIVLQLQSQVANA